MKFLRKISYFLKPSTYIVSRKEYLRAVSAYSDVLLDFEKRLSKLDENNNKFVIQLGVEKSRTTKNKDAIDTIRKSIKSQDTSNFNKFEKCETYFRRHEDAIKNSESKINDIYLKQDALNTANRSIYQEFSSKNLHDNIKAQFRKHNEKLDKYDGRIESTIYKLESLKKLADSMLDMEVKMSEWKSKVENEEKRFKDALASHAQLIVKTLYSERDKMLKESIA